MSSQSSLPRIPLRGGQALGLGLLGGLVVGGVEPSLLSPVELGGAAVALPYTAASGLLQAVVSVPAALSAGLCAWLWLRRRRDGRAGLIPGAALAAALLAPLTLHVLRIVHSQWLPDTPVLSGAGVAASVAVGAAVLVAIGLSAVAASRVPASAFRGLAALGFVATAFAVAAIALAMPGSAGSTPAPDQRNVIVVSIDSLRADVFYDYTRLHGSPVLERFVASGRRYSNGHTTFSHSLPSHASLLTGRYPPEHGALLYDDADGNRVGSPLREGVATLAEQLTSAGYETTAIVANAWLGPPYGLQSGFETFINYGEAVRLSHFDPELALTLSTVGSALRWLTLNFRSSDAATRQHPNTRLFLRWLATRSADRPFFGFLHYIEMHPPNEPPTAYRARFTEGEFAAIGGTEMNRRITEGEVTGARREAALRHIRNLYFADMARMDDFIAPVLAELLDGGWLDDTLVFLVSDHGENLFEKEDYLWKTHVYQPSSGVPFVVHPPGETAGSDRNDLVSLLDVFPTALAWTGVEAPDGIRGRDLLAAPSRSGGDWIYVQGWDREAYEFARGVIFSDGLKWVRDGGGDELFDLGVDPGELDDLTERGSPLITEYRSRFDLVVGEIDAGDHVEPLAVDELDPAVVERLKALGYIQDD